MTLDITIRRMEDSDIDTVAFIHQAAFPRQSHSREWIGCNFDAYPRIQYFVADYQGNSIGYIEWIQKSGFRDDVVLELEQIAVHPDFRNRGVGTQLIKISLLEVEKQLTYRGAHLKSIFVTTRADNVAQQLYRKILGAEVQGTIKNLYSADEVIMVASFDKRDAR